MKEIALSEIPTLDDGIPIPTLSGRVKVVFDRKSGEGQFGEWSFQGLVLQSGDSEVELKAKNLDDLKGLTGKDVTIRANKSRQHGLTGVTKTVENYQGKVYHKVLLTPSCKIVLGLPNGEQEGSLKQPLTSRTMAGIPTDEDFIPMTHDEKGAALLGVDEAKHHIMRACNLMTLCIDAADKVIGPHIKSIREELANPDMFQSVVAQLFIESSRSGLISKMPDRPISK